MNKALNLVFGAILGGLVGSAIGLLLAPMSGDELRMEINEYTRQVKEDVEKATNNRRAQLEIELANLRGEVITD